LMKRERPRSVNWGRALVCVVAIFRDLLAGGGRSFDDVNVLFVVLARLSGAAYHEPSARDARRRILAFFDRHL
jgi:hypothetical protein